MPELVYSAGKQLARWAEVSDRELLLGLRQGEEAALDVLVERKLGPLMQVVLRMVGDEEEARDLVQMTFVRVWENRHRFDERWSPNTWIYRIATNLAIDTLRARRSRERSTEPVRHHLRGVADRWRDGELAQLRQREVMAIFQELASGLTEKQRAAFLLREVEDLSSQEVAAILGCRESTVRNHLFNARRHLQRELVRRYPEYAAGWVGADEEKR